MVFARLTPGVRILALKNVLGGVTVISLAAESSSARTYGNATLRVNTWNPTLVAFDDTTPVTIYANGALNNFALSDVDAATSSSPDYEFAYINDPTNGAYYGAQVAGPVFKEVAKAVIRRLQIPKDTNEKTPPVAKPSKKSGFVPPEVD